MYPFMTRVLLPEEGGGYLIEFPDLPGCMSDGETLEEAIENGRMPCSAGLKLQQKMDRKYLSRVHRQRGFNRFPPMFIYNSPNGQRQKARVSLNSLPRYWMKPFERRETIFNKASNHFHPNPWHEPRILSLTERWIIDSLIAEIVNDLSTASIRDMHPAGILTLSEQLLWCGGRCINAIR